MKQALLRPIRNFCKQRACDRWSCRMSSNDTYYDSQSGLHLTKHNEKRISIFLDMSKDILGPDTLIPAQLYKGNSSDVPDKLQALRQSGVTGMWLPPALFPRDERNLRTLHHIAPPGFRFFVSVASSAPKDLSSSLSIMHEFVATSDMGASDLRKSLEQNAQHGIHTTMRLGKSVCCDSDAVSTASQVAALIDDSGGVDIIWISPSRSADADDVTHLCEELMYLDVAGPTIKSRIIIDSLKEEIIDETMLLGINKFAVTKEFQIDIIDEIATAQGKQVLCT